MDTIMVMQSILNQLASALQRNDEIPNIELAEKLLKTKDTKAIAEIVSGLKMDKATANDCIKVLYEIGEQNPQLILPHVDDFLDLINSKNNRLVWGTITALGQITKFCPEKVFSRFDMLYTAYDKGSVITVDYCISVFAALCASNQTYEARMFPLLIQHLANCRAKEIPQHVERMSLCFTKENIVPINEVLQKRYAEMSRSQQIRVRRVMKALEI